MNHAQDINKTVGWTGNSRESRSSESHHTGPENRVERDSSCCCCYMGAASVWQPISGHWRHPLPIEKFLQMKVPVVVVTCVAFVIVFKHVAAARATWDAITLFLFLFFPTLFLTTFNISFLFTKDGRCQVNNRPSAFGPETKEPYLVLAYTTGCYLPVVMGSPSLSKRIAI